VEPVITDAHKALPHRPTANKGVALAHKAARFALTPATPSLALICNMTPNTAALATKTAPKAQFAKVVYAPALLALPSVTTNASTSNATASIAALATTDAATRRASPASTGNVYPLPITPSATMALSIFKPTTTIVAAVTSLAAPKPSAKRGNASVPKASTSAMVNVSAEFVITPSVVSALAARSAAKVDVPAQWLDKPNALFPMDALI
jgi:hypothetical protein